MASEENNSTLHGPHASPRIQKRAPYETLLHPEAVAIVGAAREEGKVGNVILRNLVSNGYRGKIYPVNPKATGEILGIRAYPSLASIPEPVDLAVIVLPASVIIDSVRECVKKKVKFAIVISGGFSEIGEEGKELEHKLLEVIENSGTRIIGPNTVGVYFPAAKLSTALNLPERSSFPPLGTIAFISQSGALGLQTLDTISEYGTGISAFVNLGNRIDLSEEELIRYFADDPGTSSIVLYLESFHDGNKFFEAARAVSKTKPIVVLKGGRTESGAKAAFLHTGSLSTNAEVVKGVFDQVGVVQAYDETELMDYGKALAYQKPLAGGRIAIVTTAGGLGVITSDYIASEEHGVGLLLAKLSDSTKKKIRDIIVPIGSPENPIDLTSEGSTENYRQVLKILNEDDAVDGIVVYALFDTAKVDESLIDVLEEQMRVGKPMVVGTIGSSKYKKSMLAEAEKRKIPAYPSTVRAVNALKALYSRGMYLQRRGLLRAE